MPDADREMLNYLKLASASAGRNQPLGRDRFLVLAGEAACRAGLLDVAARCRELVVRENRRHLLGRFATFPDALRDADFEPLIKHLKRLCPAEQAEFLLQQQETETAATTPAELLDQIDPAANAE